MARPLAKRLATVPPSPVRKLVPYAQQAKARGVHVHHLNIGDPDIETPPELMKALTNWSINPIGYALSQGDPEFVESLTTYYKGLRYAPWMKPEYIQVTSGGSEGIAMTFFAVADPGDEIIVFEPFYANYNSYAAVTNIRLRAIPTSIEDGFHLPKREDIEKAITPKTKAILICNPNNPTGTVYTKDELDMLVDIVKEHGLFLLSDEVYREYTFDGRTQISLLSYMPQLPEQLIVLDSLSKRYSVCGLRLGMIVTQNTDLLAGALRFAQGRLSSGLVDQKVAARCVDVPASYIENVRAEYEKRRDVLYTGLQRIPGVTIPKPEGAFYTIVGLPVNDSEAFCQWLLTDFSDNNETFMVAPAAGFYATKGSGKQEVRIAFVLNTDKLKRCIELLRRALEQYKSVEASNKKK